MGAAASIRMMYREAIWAFKTYVDQETYIKDFEEIDRDGDNNLSYLEVRKWVEEKAKKDENWKVFLTKGVPVLKVAHKMATLRGGDKKAHALDGVVLDVSEFKTLLIQMFAISILWSHFNHADQWAATLGENGEGELNFEAFKMAVRTITSSHAKEELTDDDVMEDFLVIDTNNSGTIGFHEVCNFCCKFIDDSQYVDKKIVASEKRRTAKSLKVPKFFGAVGDGTKSDIVDQINSTAHNMVHNFTIEASKKHTTHRNQELMGTLNDTLRREEFGQSLVVHAVGITPTPDVPARDKWQS